MQYLVTGVAGFIGFHVARQLIDKGHDVLGIDSVNGYYDIALKEARLRILKEVAKASEGKWVFVRGDLSEKQTVDALFEQKFDRVIHLAAQAGVRHSIDHPAEYVQSNIVAFSHLLEASRRADISHFIYASTSSVYGANRKVPFSEHDSVDHPLQFYAATKRANELMAHAYSHLFDLPTTGLRFFTVYGPWGRPDMAPVLFAKAIMNGEPIKLFNYGDHARDFTYIDDIVEGIILAANAIPSATVGANLGQLSPANTSAPFRIFNIGNSQPAALISFVSLLEKSLGRTTSREMLPMQPGDVVNTHADVSRLVSATGYAPQVSLEEGVTTFAKWYLDYYH